MNWEGGLFGDGVVWFKKAGSPDEIPSAGCSKYEAIQLQKKGVRSSFGMDSSVRGWYTFCEGGNNVVPSIAVQ